MQQPEQSLRQTTEQQRAKQAWDAITYIERKHAGIKNKYGTLARGLPVMIQINGLAVTAAFLQAKQGYGSEQKQEYASLLVHLADRLRATPGYGDNDLMAFIRAASTDQYRRATAELITYATWLKRYVEAKGWKSSEGE